MKGLLRYPLDRVCVKSGVLCPSCQRKVESGQVKKEELPVMKALMELEDSMKELRKGEYVETVFMEGRAFALLRGDWGQDELDKIRRELSARLGSDVRPVVVDNNPKRLVEQIISPATLIGINELWLPNGSEQLIIRVAKRDRRRLGGRERQYEEIIASLLKKSARIVYE